MTQLAFLPLDMPEAHDPSGQPPAARLVRMPGRSRQAPRTAIGAPGFLSVRAAADRLGITPRGVRYLIQQGRLGSQRLGRMHFVPSARVEAYRRVRRARARRSQHALA